jgi:hypothetical protein
MGNLARKLQWTSTNAMALFFTSPRLLYCYPDGTVVMGRFVFLRG